MNTPANQMTVSKREFVEQIRAPGQQTKLATCLPPDISAARFTEVVVWAVQQNPELVKPSTDKTSLFLACQRAAQDGLLPDGREGALVMYGSKVQWQPMIRGLRKRLADAGFDLRAECVYDGDEFDYQLGDDPYITHRAPKLGSGVKRGDVIGAYAIATNLATGEKYREVMDLDQLNAVAAVSRSGASGPWKGPFKTEMYRKTVGKRLIKSLPIGDNRRLQELIDRDNEQFDLERPAKPAPSAAATAVQAAVRGERQPQQAQPEREPEDRVFEGEFSHVGEEGNGDGSGDDFDDPLAN
jgi:recombination protein RecT